MVNKNHKSKNICYYFKMKQLMMISTLKSAIYFLRQDIETPQTISPLKKPRYTQYMVICT